MSDEAIIAARTTEDLVVGDQVVRHSLSARLIHWAVAVTFLGALGTGLPIWTPVFGWMAALFGGLQVCGWLHPWFGIAFFVASVAMFVNWAGPMKLEKHEWKDWVGPNVGKYNGGQKLFFFVTSLGAFGLFVSGFLLWQPEAFPLRWLRESAWVLHDVTFILFAVALVLHVYLGTAAEPGTFQAMTRGTVSTAWAKLHHPKWLRELSERSSDGKR